MSTRQFSSALQAKIDPLMDKRQKIKLGNIDFDSKLLLAPMAGICTPPFRLLMEDLGAGGTVSELISCHGINYENSKTMKMLEIDEREKNVGIQLFGEDKEAMAKAAIVAQKFGPKFLDINMGCPVRKVVSKGGGSALMKDITVLGDFFKTVRDAIDIPLSIKIRTGWDADDMNALQIENIAKEAGIEWVAIHGRTRAQQYTGLANWDFIEDLKSKSSLPIIGNGDLHQPHQVYSKLSGSTCDAFMIARGCLRNPFIFIESLEQNETKKSKFYGKDYFEVIERLFNYTNDTYDQERIRLIQLRKLIVWFAAGFNGAAAFRSRMFQAKTLEDTMKGAQEYYLGLGESQKNINFDEVFMSSGHG
ncbi:MAG: tRNA-dihydrouridine synthase family protein [Bacteriovoracaceae bacterium]|jgi:nifR3 family TIM-barrel protein|nr:tRNA-dihydrouridine synthase family protein [Bacteriovoracaceae bacterium]